MAMKNPYQTYQNNAVATSSPQELTLMLYNGCIKFIRLSSIAMEKGNMEAKNTNIIKAQNILYELRSTLNMEIDLSQSMDALYDYMISQLVTANIQNDTSILKEVENLAEEFRNTWKQAMEQAKK
jgi:flagellar secretion chaperone FliS